MTLHGRISNGVVVLDEAISLPEGTPVEVFVAATHASAPSAPEKMSEEERQRVLAILDRIASLPDENPDDTFSGADHDKVLYGKP
jgi:hypothetical protein